MTLVAARRGLIVRLLRLHGPGDRLIDEKQERCRRHGQGHGKRQQIGHVLADDMLGHAGGERIESELAALTDHKSQPSRRLALQSP
jgi:hypothetical protein